MTISKKSAAPPLADPQRVTLKQIAQEVGMPMMTVSLALRNVPGRVSETTRAKIQAVADRLGYRPNMVAQGMKSGRSYNIGVVIRPGSDFFGQMVDGIHDELVPAGWLPIIHYQRSGRELNASKAVELEILHRLLDRRVDGMILFPADVHVLDDHFAMLTQRRVPLVTVDHYLAGVNADFVGTDDLAGGALAATHLLDLGHVRIAQLAGSSRYTSYADRSRGFSARCAEAGRKAVTMELVDDQTDTIVQAVRTLLSRKSRVTGIFCGADTYAPAVYQVCAELGLRIPQDVSIVGFADLPYSAYLDPPLTTIRQDPYQIGIRAARRILQRCRGEADPEGRSVERLVPELVLRSSTTHPS